jgi:hypothetical protein
MDAMMTMTTPLLLAALTLSPAADPPPAGSRIDLGGATMFVPEGYKPKDGVVDVVLHLHGAASIVEPAFVGAGWDGVLVEFNRNGLSSVYTAPFGDPALFPSLLDKALAKVREAGLAEAPRLGRVTVSTFSAGFGGARELLKVPEHFAKIDALVMADSLYCGYAGDPEEKKVDPELMSGFRRFAAEAAAGRKAFLLSHSAQEPGTYASTTETADFLIASVGAEPAPLPEGDGDWKPSRRVVKGRFEVLGYPGGEGSDHLRHMREIQGLWKKVAKGRE